MPDFAIERVGPGDAGKLAKLAPEVFGGPLEPALLAAYLAEPRSLLVVARAHGTVIGQIKATINLHPDKPADLYIDEVGATPAWQRRGVARAMLGEIERWARERGCADIWLATEEHNTAARALYAGFAQSKPCVLFFWDL